MGDSDALQPSICSLYLWILDPELILKSCKHAEHETNYVKINLKLNSISLSADQVLKTSLIKILTSLYRTRCVSPS